MNKITQTIFASSLNNFKKIAVFCSLFLVLGMSFGQTDDFTDGNFTASPAWSGNTAAFTVETATPYVASGAATDGFYLASDITTGNVTLSTASTEVNEWKFSLGTGSFSPSTTNYFGVILMSNTAVTGSITGTSWNGYYLKIGNTNPDPIELWVKNGAGTGNKVGDFPSSPNYDATALLSGLNIRVTRSASGVFELFYSTGFTYASTPTTSAGTLTNNTITTSSFFGVYSFFTNPSAVRRLFLDNVVLGTPPVAITSANSGNWSSTSTWVGGVVPTSANNAIIATGHVVTLDATTGGINTRNAGTTTTVDGGGTLAVSQTYFNNGTTTINGSFQLNSGGWVSDAVGTNALFYGSNGTLIFNNTYSAYNGNYWPTTSGPVNVTVNSGAVLTLGFNRTVTGTFQTAAGVTLSSTLTLNNICQLNGGGFFSSAPTYGSASTLIYNTTYGVGNEWTGNGAAGIGIPANVTVQSGTVTLPNSNRGIPGNITINSGTALNLNTTSGDLFVGGNWNNSGSFNPNGRAVSFNGSTNQTITKATGETFNYLINNKSAGNLILANNVTVNAASGDVLQLLNAGALNLNGQTLALTNNGGNILVNASGRTITSGVSGGILAIAGNKTVTNSGTLVTASNVTILATAGMDFGSSKTTVNGTFQINGGGYANNNAPIYGNTSTLVYNGVSSYGVGNEWTGNATTAGQGTPQNVTLTSSSIDMPNADRSLAGNLIIGSGGTLNLNGTSGDLYIGGNWNKVGAFNANNRAVFFRGTTAQSITGITTFDYLTINNTAGVTLLNNVINNFTLDFTNGKLTLGTNDLTIGNGGLISNTTATKYIVTNSTGQLKRTVASSDILFAVGNTAYNPITFNNTGGTSDVYGVRVVDGAITTGLSNTKTVSRRWLVSESVASGSNLKVIAQYNTGEENTNFIAGTNPKIGFYNGSSWTEVAATAAGSNPFTFTSNTNSAPASLTGTQYFALGKDNAFFTTATQYVVTAITPTSPGQGYPFSVTVQAQDAFGVATNVTANSTFTLTTNGNAGVLAGTSLTGTILSGTNSITVTAFTLDGSGTGVTITATNSAGLSLTAGTSATFTVQPKATKLAFGTSPPATGNVGANLTTFTVRAERPDNTLDTFYTGAITISKASGSGILSGTLTSNAVGGIATFSAAQFNAADTYTITAAAASLTSVTSGNIVITLAPVTIAAWNFFGVGSTSLPTFAATTFDTNLDNTLTLNEITRGPNAPWSNANNSFRTPGFQNDGISLTNDDYFQTTLKSDVGYSLSLSSIDAFLGGTATFANSPGVNSQFAYSLDGTTFTLIASPVNVIGASGNASMPTIDLTGVSALQNLPSGATLYLRYYASGQTTTGGWGFRSPTATDDGLKFKGNVKCVEPVAYTVTGGGSGCSPAGVAVGLSGSQVGISYQLKNGAANVGSPVTGTGNAISFGNQNTAATYTVVATNTACSLTLAMTGNAVVTITSPATITTQPQTQSVCQGSALTLTVVASGSTAYLYEWKKNGVAISGAPDAASYTITTTTLADAGTYSVDVLDDCLNIISSSNAVVTVNPTPTLNTISATAACAGSPSSVTMTGLLPNTAGSFTYTNSFTGPVVYTVSGTSDASGNFTFSTPNLPLIANGAIITITSGTATATGCSTTFTGKTVVVTVNPIVTTTFTQVAPVCSGETFTLPTTSNNGISGTWSPAINTTATTTYTFTPTSGQCGTTATMTVTVGGTTTWSGSSWDNGAPTSLTTAIISSNYSESAALNACTLTVNNNAVVTIPSGTNVSLNGALTVASGSSFTLNNNANLLQNLDVANSGAIVVKRQSSALIRLDYTLWSSPVFNQGLYSFSPFTFDNRFYTYKTDTNLYSTTALAMNVTGTNAAGVNGTDQNSVKFGVGKGYLIRVPYNHPTAPVKFNGTFTGVPTNGDKSVTLNNFGPGQRFNLVGNPYPSPISMATLASNNSSDITGSFYFWRKTNSILTSPGYCTWTAGTFVSNEEAQVFDPLGVIQVGQGFMVEAKEAGSNLTFKNGQRVANNANQIFRLSNPSNLEIPTTVEYNRLWLNMTSPASEFVQMSVGYNTGATQEEDLFDGKYFNDGPIALTSTIGTTNYTIQGRALPFTPSDVVPLSYKVTNAGNYTIAIDHVDGLFLSGTQNVFIKDNLNNTYTNLNTTPFTFASEAGTFSNRLELVYENQLSVPTTNFTANNVVIYKNNEDFVINSGVATMADITVYDIRGRVLMTKKGINATETRINAGTTNQVLLVQITTNEGIMVTKKVIN